MQREHRRAIQSLALVLVLIAVLALSACGGGGSSASPNSESPVSGTTEAANTDVVGQAAPGGGAVGDTVEAPGAVAPAPAEDRAQQDSGEARSASEQKSFDRLVIRMGNMGLQVTDVLRAVSTVQQVAAANGGYVSSGNTTQSEETSHAVVTITVPAQNFVKAFSELRDLGELVSDSTQSQDVTEEYVDLQSRQRNLEATEKSLLTLLERAGTVGEVLTVQRELGTVQGQLEQVKGRLKYLTNRTNMSTITVTLSPIPSPAREPKLEPAPRWSALEVAARAWTASLRMLQGVATVVISVTVFGWWLIPLLLGMLLWYRRSGGFRRQARPSETASPS